MILSDNGPHKILVVDDAPINIQVLNESLRERYRIFFATNGADALNLAASMLPDLILLDVMMPDMDGYEVCRRLKTDVLLQGIPVIFISAMSQQEDEAVGLELGAVDYITKPFNPAIVQLRVRNQLELKRQRDLLERLAMIDGLTGLPNRRAFDETYEREWRRAARNQSSLSLLLLDIDFFKAYNDAYGHLAGDDCLKQVAAVLARALVRPGDFMARFGGEEFVCVLPETTLEGSLQLAEKLRSAVEQLQVPHEMSSIAPVVTISIGATATVPAGEQAGAALLREADGNLYAAKHAGRNRVGHQAG